MYEKKMKYTDFNGEERTETFYFHLSKADILEMEMEVEGGFESYARRIAEAKDRKELIALFKDFIKRSYGVKSLDGRKFIKNDEVFEDFKSTPAYSDLFIKLATDDEEALKFVTGVMPEGINMDEVRRQAEIEKAKLLGEKPKFEVIEGNAEVKNT